MCVRTRERPCMLLWNFEDLFILTKITHSICGVRLETLEFISYERG